MVQVCGGQSRVRGSYYDVLGVSPDAGEDEIRARYLRLIRRYHPDLNPSPMAHARAAEINRAFRFLTDADLRAEHDAELARQRQEAVTARTMNLSRRTGGGGRALIVRRRRPLLRLYGARLALVALVAGTGVIGWRIERGLTGGRDGVMAVADDDTDNSEARQTVAQLTAASAREATAMPPVSRDAVADGVAAFRRIAAGGNMARARAFSEHCHADAANDESWDLLDSCVAFDQAAFLQTDRDPAAVSSAYFIDRHDRAAHLYVSRVSSMDAIGARLDRIRGQVSPTPPPALRTSTMTMLRHIAKGGWKLAGAARGALEPGASERVNGASNASDF